MTQSIDCARIVNQYSESISTGLEVEPIEDGCVVISPFVRPDGDYFEVIAEMPLPNVVRLTDLGETMSYLHSSGMTLSRQVMRDVRRIAQRFEVSVEVNELVTALDDDAPARGNPVHRLLQAMINVAALVERRRPNTRLRFDEEVEAQVIARGSQYDLDYQVSGRREAHVVRFHIDSGLHILAQPFSRTREGAARQFAERWSYLFTDIKEDDPKWRCFALLDDRGGRREVWTPHALTPLRDVATLVEWSKKELFTEILTAPSAR